MLQALKKLSHLASSRDKRRLWVLAAVVLLGGLLEVTGIAAALPFFQLAANPEAALANPWVASVYDYLGLSTTGSLLFITGCLVIVLLAASNALAVVIIWQQQRIAWGIAHSVSLRLSRAYASLPYEFYLTRDSGDIIKSVIDDVNATIDGVVIAGCQAVSKLLITLMIFTLLLLVNPAIAIGALLVTTVLFALVLFLRKSYLTSLGEARLSANSRRFITFCDLMNGIKTIQTHNAQEYFIKRFETPSELFAETQPKIYSTIQAPKFIIETITFSVLIAVVIYLATDERFIDTLPMFTLFALAGYRLQPAINAVYAAIANMLSSYPAVNNIYDDLYSHQLTPENAETVAAVAEHDYQGMRNSLRLANIDYVYTEEKGKVLRDVSLQVNLGQKVAIVGSSGSGKTTLVDIVAGLLTPANGTILVDDMPINASTSALWRNTISYVPQDIFLYNETIERNIAFGSEQLDRPWLEHVCKLVQLGDFIEKELPQGYESLVGDGGVALSGGQRQRIGLARALYRKPDVLVLDEATNALDNITESAVINAIADGFPEMTTIAIAHRISTVRSYDQLVVLEAGQVVAMGTYEELLESSRIFRDLISYA